MPKKKKVTCAFKPYYDLSAAFDTTSILAAIGPPLGLPLQTLVQFAAVRRPHNRCHNASNAPNRQEVRRCCWPRCKSCRSPQLMRFCRPTVNMPDSSPLPTFRTGLFHLGTRWQYDRYLHWMATRPTAHRRYNLHLSKRLRSFLHPYSTSVQFHHSSRML